MQFFHMLRRMKCAISPVIFTMSLGIYGRIIELYRIGPSYSKLDQCPCWCLPLNDAIFQAFFILFTGIYSGILRPG